MTSSGKIYLEFGEDSLLKYLQAMKVEADGARASENSEFIHRMRVASRRLRTALTVFGDCLPGKKTERFRKKIRRLSGTLAEARDRDVQTGFLIEFLKCLPEKKYTDGIKRLLLRSEQARKRIQPVIVRTLDGDEYSGLFEEMEKTFKNAVHKGKGASSIKRRFKEETRWRFEETMKYEEVARSPEKIEALHDMRICIKHLRYCLEIFDPAVEGLGEFIKTVKQMQEILGDIHDCDIWLDYLPSFIDDEEKRAFDYCGSSAPVARLKPGIMYLAEERKAFRHTRYEEFISLWDSSADCRNELYAMLSD